MELREVIVGPRNQSDSSRRRPVARRLALIGVGALVLGTAALSSAIPARAGSPNTISVTAGSSNFYDGTLQPIEPDPIGPPAPTCGPADGTTGCDHETVNLSAGSFSSPPYTFGLAVTPTFTPAGPGQCLDVVIEDSSGNVLNSATCITSGTTTAAAHLAAPASYTIEIDADASTEPTAAQPFHVVVDGLATNTTTSGGGNAGGPPASTFSHEITVDPQRADGEPDLAVSSDGQDMYSATPWGFSTTVSFAWKSADGGTQWTNLHGGNTNNIPVCPTADALRPDCSRGGGDAEIQLSAPESPGGPQTVQYQDLNGLDTISCAYSTNGGDTFTDLLGFTLGGNPVPGSACNEGGTVPTTCQTNPTGPTCGTLGTDRPWVAVWPKGDQPSGATADHLFMVFDTGDQPPSGDAAIYSTDGGHSWTAGCTTITASSCVGGANAVGARPGPLVINPTLLNTVTGSTSLIGGTYPTLYEFMGSNGNGTQVNISCDGGQTWVNESMATGQAGSTTDDFVVGAIDTAGNLYAAWATANGTSPWLTYYTHTTGAPAVPAGSDCSAAVPGGSSADWSTPAPINGPTTTVSNATGVNYAVMPWITAGDPGRVDLAYYGDDTDSGIHPDSDASATWYLHTAQTLNGLSTTPAFTDVKASEQPMHHNSICFSGIGCMLSAPFGDRNLLDFFELKLDPSGRAVVIYTDDNNTAQDPSANPGAGLISSVQQSSGPSLYAGVGNVPPLSSKFLGQSTDLRSVGAAGGCNSPAAVVCEPSGDALISQLGHNLDGLEVPAADISQLQVLNKDPSTLEFLFNVQNLSQGPNCSVANQGCAAVNTGANGAFPTHTGATWLVTWHWNNDVWFAEATSDPTGTTTSFIAGRPQSIFNDAEPKALEYVANTETNGSGGAVAVTGNFNLTNNTVEIDVPLADIGGVGTGSDTTNHELYGLTGWTGDSGTSLPSATCDDLSTDVNANCQGGTLGFFDNIDQTAPLDVVLGQPGNITPETPSVLLLVGFGLLAAGGGVYGRRRRASRAAKA